MTKMTSTICSVTSLCPDDYVVGTGRAYTGFVVRHFVLSKLTWLSTPVAVKTHQAKFLVQCASLMDSSAFWRHLSVQAEGTLAPGCPQPMTKHRGLARATLLAAGHETHLQGNIYSKTHLWDVQNSLRPLRSETSSQSSSLCFTFHRG